MVSATAASAATAANATAESENVTQVAPAATAKVEPAAADSQRNGRRKLQAEAVLASLLEMGLNKGFFGTGAITIAFHDGNIQHITRRIEHMIKS